MTTYLFERVHVVPGQTAEYIRGFSERWLPLSDEYDRDLYRVSGFFVPDVLYNTQPAVNILWTIDSWEAWDGRHVRGTAQEKLIKTHEFYVPAVGWRSGWTDMMIESLPFSPNPPVRPESVRQGSAIVSHRFQVRPDQCGQFVETFENDVLPSASETGLTLELFARAIGHPTEYVGLWSIPTGEPYISWRSKRDPSVVAGILPNFDRAWATLVDIEEQEMTPTWFSPLGGSGVNPREPSEEQFSV